MSAKNLKKLTLLLSLAFVAILSLVACGTTGSTGGSDQNTLTVAVQGNPGNPFDPHNSNDSATSLLNVQMFETLVFQTEDLEIVPMLAESFEQIDDVTWEFVIRDDVFFHNGEKLTVEDVAFSLDRGSTSNLVAEILGMIQEVQVIDEHTVHIITEYPFAPLLNHLAHPAASIVNKMDVEEVEAAGGVYGLDNPVGTGPFVFESFSSGDRTVFSRNENYWGEAPVFEELVVRTITDGSTRAMALETGEIDISLDVVPAEVSRMDSNPDVELLRRANLSTNYIGFNTQNEYLSDVRIRQAISYAVDTEAIVTHIMENIGIPAQGPIGPNVWGFNENLHQYDVDFDRARELMAEAGYPDGGFSLSLWANSETQARIDIATNVARVLEDELGINVTINQVAWSEYLIATENGEADMFILGWGTITGDADYGLWSLFHSSSPAGAGNRSFYSNPEVDRLLELGRSTSGDERLQAYLDVQEIIVEDAPWVFINNGEVIAGTLLSVQGFVLNPTNAHRFSNVHFE
ncbi:MAG: ABC transporter substrate-binding protein [Turicibacter sp.]|nr:ABC transporter substrate-binding protein [Turicibacter sp.]